MQWNYPSGNYGKDAHEREGGWTQVEQEISHSGDWGGEGQQAYWYLASRTDEIEKVIAYGGKINQVV